MKTLRPLFWDVKRESGKTLGPVNFWFAWECFLFFYLSFKPLARGRASSKFILNKREGSCDISFWISHRTVYKPKFLRQYFHPQHRKSCFFVCLFFIKKVDTHKKFLFPPLICFLNTGNDRHLLIIEFRKSSSNS